MKKLSLALIILNLLNLLKTVPYDPQYHTFKIDDNTYIKIEEDFSISIINQ